MDHFWDAGAPIFLRGLEQVVAVAAGHDFSLVVTPVLTDATPFDQCNVLLLTRDSADEVVTFDQPSGSLLRLYRDPS